MHHFLCNFFPRFVFYPSFFLGICWEHCYESGQIYVSNLFHFCGFFSTWICTNYELIYTFCKCKLEALLGESGPFFDVFLSSKAKWHEIQEGLRAFVGCWTVNIKHLWKFMKLPLLFEAAYKWAGEKRSHTPLQGWHDTYGTGTWYVQAATW